MSFTVSIDPNSTQIVFASETHVAITGHWCEHDDADKYRVSTSGTGVLHMCRQLYTNAMQEWLDEQADYCGGERFCGDGYIGFAEGVELQPDGATLPAHLIEPRPPGLTQAEYFDFMTKRVHVRAFTADCDTEFYVEINDEEDAEAADLEPVAA